MELYCCNDEVVLQKITEAEAKASPTELAKLPDPSKLPQVLAAGSFDTIDLGWLKVPAVAQLAGDVAIIKVEGALVAGNAGYKRLFGTIGYEDIKAAVVEAQQRSDVKAIMMMYNTPGGSVSSLKTTAEFLKGAQAAGKPMVGYATTAASAGYWLASSTGKIYADDMSMIGSIGTIMQVVSVKKAQANAGVEYNVFKSGKLKMAGNPNEELSDEAKEYFQGLVDDMAAMFYESIASMRGKSASKLRKDFGDGRTVMGVRALAGGLVDDLSGLQGAMKDLRRKVNAKSCS